MHEKKMGVGWVVVVGGGSGGWGGIKRWIEKYNICIQGQHFSVLGRHYSTQFIQTCWEPFLTKNSNVKGFPHNHVLCIAPISATVLPLRWVCLKSASFKTHIQYKLQHPLQEKSTTQINVYTTHHVICLRYKTSPWIQVFINTWQVPNWKWWWSSSLLSHSFNSLSVWMETRLCKQKTQQHACTQQQVCSRTCLTSSQTGWSG